jgi:hypothetical protein
LDYRLDSDDGGFSDDWRVIRSASIGWELIAKPLWNGSADLMTVLSANWSRKIENDRISIVDSASGTQPAILVVWVQMKLSVGYSGRRVSLSVNAWVAN